MKCFVGALLFFLLACFAWTGCGEMGTSPKSASRGKLVKTVEMEKSFQVPERLFYAKRFAQAKTAYQAYIRQYPYNALTPKAYFRLGELAFHEKEFKEAAGAYRKALQKGVDPDWGDVAAYKRAVSYSRLEDDAKVFSSLDLIDRAHLDRKIGLRAGSLRVATAKKTGDSLQEKKGCLEVLDSYEGGISSDQGGGDYSWLVSEKTAREEIQSWVDGAGSEDEFRRLSELKKWAKEFEGRASGGILVWKIAKLYQEKGDYRAASDWAQKYLQASPKGGYVSAARLLASESDKRGESAAPAGENRSLVGVLLPLSGKYGVYGQSVLHGIECAAGIFEPCKGDLGVNLVVRDTFGDPRSSARAVDDLSANPEIRAVVGPLPQVETDEAAAAAERNRLPMVALSQKPGVPQAGEFIFRNFLTVQDQVATLVDYACRDKHWKKFAVLYPSDNAGEEYKNSFAKEIERCGGKIVSSASYPPESASVSDAARTLKADGKFQALFIPDVYRRIPRIVQTLKAQGALGEGVRLLGAAGWDHPDLVAKGGEDVEGAVYVNGFFADSASFATRDFVSTFQSAYGVKPTLLEAYAYDTMRLIGEILRDHPAATRDEIQQALAKKKNFPGVTGNISFDADGDARRRLFLMMIDQGEIKELK